MIFLRVFFASRTIVNVQATPLFPSTLLLYSISQIIQPNENDTEDGNTFPVPFSSGYDALRYTGYRPKSICPRINRSRCNLEERHIRLSLYPPINQPTDSLSTRDTLMAIRMALPLAPPYTKEMANLRFFLFIRRELTKKFSPVPSPESRVSLSGRESVFVSRGIWDWRWIMHLWPLRRAQRSSFYALAIESTFNCIPFFILRSYSHAARNN